MATVGSGLLRSDDLGARWVREPGLPADARLYSLCATTGDLLVGGHGVVYRRTERAWSELALPAGAGEVAVVAVVDDAIVVGARPLGLLRSQDGGRTWAPTGEGGPEGPAAAFTSLLANPAVPGEVWAGLAGGGVLTSDDGGRTWTDVSVGLPSRDVHALAWSSGGILLAALAGGVAIWRSARWVSSVFEPADRHCRALAARADDPGVVYCGFGDAAGGSRGGVARSTDGGRSWYGCAGLPPQPGGVGAVATLADLPALVLAASSAGTVLLSADEGESWAEVLSTGAETRAVACMAE